MLIVVVGAFIAGVAAAGGLEVVVQLRRGPGGRRRRTAWRSVPVQAEGVILGALLVVMGLRPGLQSLLVPVAIALTVACGAWTIWSRSSRS